MNSIIYQIPGEFRAISAWERAIGMINGSMRVHSVQFVSSAHLFPEEKGSATLQVRFHRGPIDLPLANLHLGRSKIPAWTPVEFDLLYPDLEQNDVLSLSKANLQTNGFSLPESMVQIWLLD